MFTLGSALCLKQSDTEEISSLFFDEVSALSLPIDSEVGTNKDWDLNTHQCALVLCCAACHAHDNGYEWDNFDIVGEKEQCDFNENNGKYTREECGPKQRSCHEKS